MLSLPGLPRPLASRRSDASSSLLASLVVSQHLGWISKAAFVVSQHLGWISKAALVGPEDAAPLPLAPSAGGLLPARVPVHVVLAGQPADVRHDVVGDLPEQLRVARPAGVLGVVQRRPD